MSLREEQTVAAATVNPMNGLSHLADSATVHTTVWDIHMRLFPQHAPKAVENLVGHTRSGGTSIWGREFEDEFSDEVKHDR